MHALIYMILHGMIIKTYAPHGKFYKFGTNANFIWVYSHVMSIRSLK